MKKKKKKEDKKQNKKGNKPRTRAGTSKKQGFIVEQSPFLSK